MTDHRHSHRHYVHRPAFFLQSNIQHLFPNSILILHFKPQCFFQCVSASTVRESSSECQLCSVVGPTVTQHSLMFQRQTACHSLRVWGVWTRSNFHISNHSCLSDVSCYFLLNIAIDLDGWEHFVWQRFWAMYRELAATCNKIVSYGGIPLRKSFTMPSIAARLAKISYFYKFTYNQREKKDKLQFLNGSFLSITHISSFRCQYTSCMSCAAKEALLCKPWQWLLNILAYIYIYIFSG